MGNGGLGEDLSEMQVEGCSCNRNSSGGRQEGGGIIVHGRRW